MHIQYVVIASPNEKEPMVLYGQIKKDITGSVPATVMNFLAENQFVHFLGEVALFAVRALARERGRARP